MSADFSPPDRFIGHAGLPTVALAKAGRVTLPMGSFLSFQFHDTKIHKNSAIFGGGSVGSGGSVAANAATFSH